ncbi:GNAT family N-acetyltransferase [uncultured Schumannella sp.]|uniref:GNAT family N-acetyltransferase n=1 Tax=uncultured Schumannella sp. TaxID=1195956 RepID=UPI0025FC2620|nr:GNAT family N-acetyltransferase [uncultured Schumannella sp.]
MPPLIRRATAADADGVAHVHVRSWQETYRHLVAPEQLDALQAEDRVERWREIITGSEEEVWVATDGDEVVGWAAASGRDASRHPRGRELNGLYLLAAHHGTGAGAALFEAALADSPAFLWIAQNNPRAAAFYRKHGFAPDGATSEYATLGTTMLIERWAR